MRALRRSIILAAAGALASCGFHPLYGVREGQAVGAQSQLGSIRVALIPERSGQLVRQALQQRLEHDEGAAKRYELSVAFSLSTDAIGIQRDTTVTRLRMVGTANWLLRGLDQSNAIVTSGLARSLDGINVLDQQYFEADLASETATRRIADAIADQITLQLASYFARVPSTG